MQFKPVVLCSGKPACRTFVTKIQKREEFGQNIQKVSIKYRNKKNEQVLPNPSPRVRKAQRLFFFTCIKFLLPENQSFFLPLKNKLQLPIK